MLSEDDAAASAELEDILGEGEHVLVMADGLVRESGVAFDKCRVVLTPARLIVLKSGWPWGYKVDRSIVRADCILKNKKKRLDGSQLVVIAHPDGDLCLYFGRGEADAVTALSANFVDGLPVIRLDP